MDMSVEKSKIQEMKREFIMIGRKLLGCIALIVAVGCGDDTEQPNNPGPDGGTSGSDPAVCGQKDTTNVCATLDPSGMLRISDADNYFFDSTITVTPSVVKGLSDLTIDWSGLTVDLFGRQMNPATDVGLVLVSLWSMNQQQLADEINNDTLQMADNAGAIWLETEGQITQTNLLSLGIQGAAPEPEEIWPYFDHTSSGYDPTKYTHLIMVQSGTIPGSNARMLGFFTLSGDTENTTVSLTPQSSLLVYEANIRDQNWLAVAPRNPNLIIDWENMVKNSAGNDFVPTKISRVVVAQYTNMSHCEIETNFVFLEERATAWYEKELETVSTSFALNTLVDLNGVPFPGIDATGTWVVGLFCDSCANSAPWFLTVLHPCG